MKLTGKDIERAKRQVPDYVKSMPEVVKGANSLSPEFFDWFEVDPQAKAAVHIADGSYQPQQSAQEYIYKGTVDSQGTECLHVVSNDGKIGGVYVTGNTAYEVDYSTISLAGDATGIGGPATGITADEGAQVTVRDSMVDVSGLTHYAAVADRGGVLKAYGSSFISHGAPFGHGEAQPTKTMTTPPPPLMISGNSRTFCGLRGSQSFFYDCVISADGWAALSTEAPEGYVYVEANDSKIITVQSGYAVYADPGTHIVLNRCDVDSADMIGIIGGEADIRLQDCYCDCGANGFLAHSVFGDPAEISVVDVKGGEIFTKNDFFLIKSRNLISHLEAAEITAENGVLIHTIKNEDPLATAVGEDPFGVEITMKQMSPVGDILHEDSERDMYLYLESTTLRGAIQNAHLYLDQGSKWYADKDSTVVLASGAELEQFDAPKDITITAYGTEDAEYELKSGGRLVLKARK